ncbi:condensin-2 complex subunit H2-like isoform X2 [Argiope bruennichi]|nr:condensin-2 complex subunit H2-like isoform X2 [Argiope bruennichi]XP_055953542.1 condensin-2 complex subunit H2-like isoform X2 [Argiope bruennichi]XP_055953543.1 condensin-2 complex subunit H2-like isoform X2 [Argiope bruennichi]XP_055953544.1 condensin-2 complex subunit H2-like isoform X2 [Argiope bruennichi]
MSRPKTTDAFSELLNPVKDPERSFAINIAELLQSYVKSFLEGSVNFNSAALMIQGSSSIYGKKVEYLHNLATKLYASLLKHKKDDGAKKDTKEREKHTRESKFSDPFCSTEIKLGKNLSCLRKKFASKNSTNKKTSKKSDKKFTFTPVDLFPLEGEDKGMELLDVHGQSLGNKYEFTLNKCKVTSSGWLLLPTVSPDLIPSEFSTPDYTTVNEYSDDNMCNDLDSQSPESSPLDEGYPPSSGESATPATQQSSQGVSSVPSSQGTDEGVGSLPCTPLESGSQPESGTADKDSSQLESNDNTPAANGASTETPMEGTEEGPVLDGLNHSIEGNENIPLEDADVAPRPRRSTRQALKLCQIQEDEAKKQGGENQATTLAKDESSVVKRAIQKKNTYNLPSKLRTKNGTAIDPVSAFCARTFFSMDRKYPKSSSPHSFEVRAFQNHNDLFNKFRSLQASLSNINQRRKEKGNAAALEENDDIDEEVDIEGVESNLDDPVANEDVISKPLEARDIVIENNPGLLPMPVYENENPLAEDEPIFPDDGEFFDDELSAYDDKELEDSFANAARLQCDLFREDLQKYIQTSDISQRIHAWEGTMKPFLEGLNKREEFDINLYGSRILNAFEDSNRKQTITFRNFCKGKEKWEIHRYFMALLPLVNIGNVSIEAEQLGDGEEDILVTLLSRKMHHKELEEFGHNEGEHS